MSGGYYSAFIVPCVPRTAASASLCKSPAGGFHYLFSKCGLPCFSPLFPFFLQVSSFSFHWVVSLKKEKVVCSFKSISHWKQREINKLRGRRWIEKVTTWNAAIVGERKSERIVDSVKQSEGERWKPPFRHAANRTFPLVCQSPILSSYIPSLSPDAPSEVFPLMKRIEFFKLKSLIRNKVFHPFTIAL